MGLHSGDGMLDADGEYVGADVHRAARVAGAGHGGQVLLSETTSALVADELPEGVAIRGLGEHRLKDLRPERICQLVIDGLQSDFPPIRTLDRRPNNLPTQLTSFVGREAELRDAAQTPCDDPAAHADRARRHRQDPPLAPARRRRRP